MDEFKDYFSDVSGAYARFRPLYPPALFDRLAALTARHDRAWDCATGTGQAAHGLAAQYSEVIATDASVQQIAAAIPHPRVRFAVATAEASGLAEASVDLVCVAQAAHWFNMVAFNRELQRVLRPGGAAVLIAYKLFTSLPAVDALIAEAYHGELAKHWAPERAIIDRDYADLALDLEPVTLAPAAMHANWSAEQLLGYLETWSGIRALNRADGRDVVAEWAPAIKAAWGTGTRPVTWPLILKAGRKPAA